MNYSPRQGQIVDDKFELLESLGSGGIGSVFKARQLNCNRIVALKLLHSQFAQDPEYKERFLREAKSLSQLSHDNIITVYQLGLSPQGQLYITMELIEGQSLKKLATGENKLPTIRALRIIRDAALALAYVHSKGIVHRDIKPENIIVTNAPSPDTVKVIDFGLVNLAELTDQKLTKTNTLMGTAAYMSPEQCSGQKVDKASDIYSLAVCLYETLTGRQPFTGDSAIGVMYKHIHDPVPQITPQMVERFDPLLQALVDKGMEKSPEKRFGSMEEFADELAEQIKMLEDGKGLPSELLSISIGIGILTMLLVTFFAYKNAYKSHSKEAINATVADSIRKSPIQKLNDLRQKTSTGNKLQLQSESFQIAIEDSAGSIPRATKLKVFLDYAERLKKEGLPVSAIRVFQKIIDDVNKLGLPPIQTVENDFGEVQVISAKLGIGNCYLEMGNIEKARESMTSACKDGIKDWAPVAALAAPLNDLSILKSCLQNSANSPHQLLQIASTLRRYNKIDLFEECLKLADENAERGQFSTTQSTYLKIEHAYLLINKHKFDEALKLLKSIPIKNFEKADKKQRADLIPTAAVLFADLDSPKDSLKFIQMMHPDDLPKSHSTQKALSAEEYDKQVAFIYTQSKNHKNQVEIIEKIDELIAQTNDPAKLAALYSRRAFYSRNRALQHYFETLCFRISEKPGTQISDISRLKYKLKYAEGADGASQIRDVALALYKQILADSKHINTQNQLDFTQEDIITASVAAAEILLDWGRKEDAIKVVQNTPLPSRRNARISDLLNIQLRLKMFDAAKASIEYINDAYELNRLSRICIERNQLALARICMTKGQELLNSSDEQQSSTKRLVLLPKELIQTAALISIESGKPEEARSVLPRIQPLSKVQDRDDEDFNANTAAIKALSDKAS